MSWTDFTQYLDSTDSNIIYISEDGNDSTGQPYNSNTVGADPTQPSISIQPYKTFEYVWTNVVRANKKDWVLFKRGNTFIISDNGGLLTWGGRLPKTMNSSFAPVGNLIGAYGSTANERPIIKTSTSNYMFRGFAQTEANKLWNLAVVSLDLRINTDNQTNNIASGSIFSITGPSNIIIEDCVLNGSNEFTSWPATDSDLIYNSSNITLNRCVIKDSYNTTGHNQGIFLGGTDKLTIQECVFDNNGYKQNVNNPSIWTGRAAPSSNEGGSTSNQTIEAGHGIQPKRDWFSRNIYASAYYNLKVLGNIFSRSASGHQFRSGGLIERNVFLCNTEGISNTAQSNSEYLESAEYTKNLVMLSDFTDSTGSNNLLGGISALDTNFVTVDNNIGKEYYRASIGLVTTGYPTYAGEPAYTLYQSTQTNNIIHLKNGSVFSTIVNHKLGNTTNAIENLSGSGNQFIIETTNKKYIETNVSEPVSPENPPESELPYSTYLWDNNHYLNASSNYFSISLNNGSYSTWQSNGFDENSTSYSSLSDMASALGWINNNPDYGWERNILSYMKLIDNTYVEDVNVTTDVLTSNPRASAPKVKDVLRWGTLDIWGGSGYQVGDTFKVTQNSEDILTITVTTVSTSGAITRTNTTVIDPNYLERPTTSISFATVSVNGSGATTQRNNFFSDAIAEDWAKQYHAFSVFITRAKLNRLGSWNSNYTADALNSYIREGYGKAVVGGGYSESIEPNPPVPPEGGNQLESNQLGSIQNIETIRHTNYNYPILSLDILGDYNNSDFLVLRKNKTSMIGIGIQDFIIKYRNTLLRNLDINYTIPENFDLSWNYKQGPITNPNLIAPCFLWIRPEEFVTNNEQDKYLSLTNVGNFSSYDTGFTAPENLSASVGSKGLNNYQPVDFNGTTNYYLNEEAVDNLLINTSDDFAIGFVLKTNSINTNKENCIISGGRLGDSGSLYIGLDETENSKKIKIVTQSSSTVSTIKTPNCYTNGDPLVGVVYRINSIVKIRVDGVNQEIDDPVIYSVDDSDPESIIGATRNEIDEIVNYLDHSFYELVFMKNTNEIPITEDTIKILEGYFGEKYKIKDNLPSNHPYFVDPPRTNVIGSFNISQTPTEPSVVCDTLTATSSETNFTSSGGTETITVGVADGACEWFASTLNNWITINTSSGEGNGSFTFTVSSNTSTQRTGSILVTSGSAPSVSINITQAAQSVSQWDPSQLSSLEAWYKADAITGLSDGDPVSSWLDVTSNNHDLSATSTNEPVYKTAILNGLPVVEFDGTETDLGVSSTGVINSAADAWVYVVHTVDNAASNPFVLYISTTSNSTARLAIQPRSTGSVWFRVQGSAIGDTSAGATTSATWFITGMRTDGATLHAYQDGTELSLTNSTITSGFPAETAAVMRLGNDNSGSNLDGYIAEVVIGNEALSDSEREKVEGYLAHKWGLTSSLPNDHPYKSSAPTV